jgi:hypothetical protein
VHVIRVRAIAPNPFWNALGRILHAAVLATLRVAPNLRITLAATGHGFSSPEENNTRQPAREKLITE